MKSIYLIGLSWWLACAQLGAQATAELDLFKLVEVSFRNQRPGQTFYQLDQDRMNRWYQRGLPEHIRFSLPLKNDTLKLVAQQVTLFHPEALVENANDEILEFSKGIHYQAFRGDTLFALSVFPDQMVAQIQTPTTYFTLGKVPGNDQTYSLAAETPDAVDAFQTCFTSDELEPEYERIIKKLDRSVQNRAALPPLDVYFELDHRIFLEQNESIEQCLIYIASLFNSVTQLYRLEGIGLRIKGIKIWDQPDDYATVSSYRALSDFRTKLSTEVPDPDWDIGVLLSRFTNDDGLAPNGGLAHVDGLCSQTLRYGYANLGSSVQDFPVYSFAVFVIAHEMGHTIASPHTHNCSWPNGPLDDCYCPEGSCLPGPSAAAQGGGTVMSYCYVVKPFDPDRCPEFPSGGNPGVNFLNAFGPYPGDLMRLRISEKSCLQDRPVEDLPNLRIDDIQKLERKNDTVFVSGLVLENDGQQATPEIGIGVFQGNRYLGALSANAMAGNTTRNYNYYFILPDTSHQVDFSFQADIFQQVVEWHEGDNLYQTTISESLDFPVLVWQSLSSLIDESDYFLFPNLNLQNLGWAKSEDIQFTYSLALAPQEGATFFPLSQKNITGLEGKSEYEFPLGFYEPALGLSAANYYLRIDLRSGDLHQIYFWPTAITIASPNWEWFKK